MPLDSRDAIDAGSPELPSTDTPPVRGISARTVWVVLGLLAVAGVVTLATLAYLWRTGRLSGVEDASISGPDQLAAFAGSFPLGGASPLVEPRSVSVSDDSIYVTEPDAARVSVFGLDGRFERRLAVEAAGPAYPVDACSLGDTLYIVDAAGGHLLAMPVRGGASKIVADSLTQPTAVAAYGDSLLVADAGSGLWRFSLPSGELERIAGPESTRGFAGGIALDGDRALVSDAGGSRVLDVALAGGDVGAFGDRVNLPRGVAIDGSRRVWVADVFGGTVMVFDASGQSLGDIESEDVAGPDVRDIGSPQGVAFSTDTNRLFVVDSTGGRVFVYSLAK